MTPKHYLIIDLEATCCNKGTVPRDEMETIEIGAVVVDATTLKIVDEYEIFIKPILNSTLTSFCKGLTTITQNDVDEALGYKEAVEDFKRWFSQYDEFLFCSWGEYDKNQFKRDCKLHKIDYPFNNEHLNIKREFAKVQDIKPCDLDTALDHVGLELVGTHHRGIDDARNMGCLMPYIVNVTNEVSELEKLRKRKKEAIIKNDLMNEEFNKEMKEIKQLLKDERGLIYKSFMLLMEIIFTGISLIFYGILIYWAVDYYLINFPPSTLLSETINREYATQNIYEHGDGYGGAIGGLTEDILQHSDPYCAEKLAPEVISGVKFIYDDLYSHFGDTLTFNERNETK